VHLRPGQKAADPTTTLQTYWGGEVIFRDVPILPGGGQ